MGQPLFPYPILQHAFVVADLDTGIRRWIDTVGAGPFYTSRHHEGQQHRYRDRPCDAILSYAFGQHGGTHVQLIEQHDDHPSIYNDMYARGEEGFHHIATLVPEADLGAEIDRFAAAGIAVASSLWSRADVVYLDTREVIGCYFELHGSNDDIEGVFRMFREGAEGWDGVTDPVRSTRDGGPDPAAA